MSNNYTFLDATGVTQTAASSVVAGAQQPLVQISSMPAVTLVGTVSLAPTSVATLQGTNPWIVNSTGSVLTAPYLIRNDAVSSALGVDLTYRPFMGDSAGRVIVKPFAASESNVYGYMSVNGTSVTTAIAAAGTGLRNYITDVQVANTGSVATLVTFQDGAASVIGYTIAPATGGSNIVGLATPMRTGANASFDFKAITASSTLYVTASGYKAP